MAPLHPAATTRRPNSATRGVTPGISLITMTTGPPPARYTVRLPRIASRHPRTVASPLVHPSSHIWDPPGPKGPLARAEGFAFSR